MQGLTLNQAVEKMRGPVNTKIRLRVMRKGQDKPLDVTLARDKIRVRSVRARVERTTSPTSASPPSTSRPPKA